MTLVLTPAQTLVQNIITTTPLITLLHLTMVTDIAMINILKNRLHEQSIFLAQTINLRYKI